MDKEQPIRLVVPPGHEAEDKNFIALYNALKPMEELGAFLDILRAEHWYAWWMSEAKECEDRVSASLTPDAHSGCCADWHTALVNAEAWLKWAKRK